ncbi:MAG: hypothetical protein OXK79_06970 [Chloroflexota bacterium]|nr:hypothetical protein [Chloroflexota bacterium]
MSASPRMVRQGRHYLKHEFPPLGGLDTPTSIRGETSVSIDKNESEPMAAAIGGGLHGGQPSDRHGTGFLQWEEGYSEPWASGSLARVAEYFRAYTVGRHTGQTDRRPNEWAERVKDQIRRALPDSEEWVDVSEDAVRYALLFVDALPFGTDEPDVEPTPQGEIDFAWDNGTRTFGVVVEPSGELGFAGIYDKVNLYGNVAWDNKNDLPEFVTNGIRWVRGNDL